jgi:cobalt-precorrin 5A hydrolase
MDIAWEADMKLAIISLSKEGSCLVSHLARWFSDAHLFLHTEAGDGEGIEASRFDSIMALTADIFGKYRGLVYVAPCGVVVRSLAPCLKHKTTDPAVVVIDAVGRFAVSLLSGHEGGANALAIAVSNIIGAEPVITTTTDALKTIIVGVGCRRATESSKILHAIELAVKEAGTNMDQVRLLASADIKADEQGLILAAQKLGIPLRFIPSEDIRSTTRIFERSHFVEKQVNLPAVAEAAALLAGRRAQLILRKRVYNGVTAAVARESFL